MAKPSSGLGCLLPFGGIFAAAGGFILYSALTGGLTGEDGETVPPLFGVLFSLPFLLSGLAMAGVGVGSFRSGSKQRALAQRFPAQPWRQKPQWQTDVIGASSSGSMAIIIFAVLWNAIAFPVGILAITSEDNLEWFVYGLILLFPLLGVGLAYWAALRLMRYLRWGRSTLEMAEMPGVVGGSLGGVIITNRPVRFQEPITLNLKCQEWVRDSQGYNQHQTVWQTTHSIAPHEVYAMHGGSAIPVFLSIPYDCPETEVDGGKTWTLTASGKTPGPDLEVSFEVPVFKTQHSNPQQSEAVLMDDAIEEGTLATPDAIGKSFDVYDDVDGAWVIAKKKKLQWEFLLPLILVLGVSVGVLFSFFRDGDVIIMTILGGLFLLEVLILGLIALFVLRSLEIRVYPDRAESRWSVFGLLAGGSSVRADEISDVRPATSTRVNNQPWWHIELEKRGGGTHSLRLLSPDKAVIYHCIKHMRERWGLSG